MFNELEQRKRKIVEGMRGWPTNFGPISKEEEEEFISTLSEIEHYKHRNCQRCNTPLIWTGATCNNQGEPLRSFFDCFKCRIKELCYDEELSMWVD